MSFLKECIQSVVFPIEKKINNCRKKKKKKKRKKQSPKKKCSKMIEYYDEKILEAKIPNMCPP